MDDANNTLEQSLADIRRSTTVSEHARLVAAVIATRRARLCAAYRRALRVTPKRERSALRGEVADHRRRYSLAAELAVSLESLVEGDAELMAVGAAATGSERPELFGQAIRLDALCRDAMAEAQRLTRLPADDPLTMPIVAAVVRAVVDPNVSLQDVAEALERRRRDDLFREAQGRAFRLVSSGVSDCDVLSTIDREFHALDATSTAQLAGSLAVMRLHT